METYFHYRSTTKIHSSRATLRAGKNDTNFGEKTFEVRSESGVTLGDVIDATRAPSRVFMRLGGYKKLKWTQQLSRQQVLNRQFPAFGPLSLDEVLDKIGRTSRKPAKVYCRDTRFGFNNMVIPSEEEWRTVK